ncbi:flavodoxin [Alteromonas aestuariivivens]|uniref:Flavodoxin n=1 Tax=Alteromonas aestuariivivens TaxID=1938339 RepID=A0A3D8M526_9ALTE|nr:DnaT-like ssDNA-binding domain-containing protein [Alteromonas aestuariivivens]RDV24789.1 flavodoxin [Alteromonas aestuariivivens]
MYTQAEIDALNTPLCNESRVLYCLGLRPWVNPATATTEPLNYKILLSLLNGEHSQSAERPFTLGRQINRLLKKLENAGLIALPTELTFEQNLNGKVIILPLTLVETQQYAQLHQTSFAISVQWKPEQELYQELAALLGIIEHEYNQEDVGEFIAYWLGRPQAVFSQFQWTQKFAYAIKRKRTAMGMVPVKKVGTQQVSVAPTLEADDNARKLVEKYSSSKKAP